MAVVDKGQIKQVIVIYQVLHNAQIQLSPRVIDNVVSSLFSWYLHYQIHLAGVCSWFITEVSHEGWDTSSKA